MVGTQAPGAHAVPCPALLRLVPTALAADASRGRMFSRLPKCSFSYLFSNWPAPPHCRLLWVPVTRLL